MWVVTVTAEDKTHMHNIPSGRVYHGILEPISFVRSVSVLIEREEMSNIRTYKASMIETGASRLFAWHRVVCNYFVSSSQLYFHFLFHFPDLHEAAILKKDSEQKHGTTFLMGMRLQFGMK